MKEEFLDYIEDVIEAMDDAVSFVEGVKREDLACMRRRLPNRKTVKLAHMKDA